MSGRVDYEERRANRVARLGAASEKARAAARSKIAAARKIGSGIPFGQPILVGHHSEGRHRRDAQKIHDNMRKGFELSEQAEALSRRAAAAELNTAISSDDPQAIEKLRAKITAIESQTEGMKQANAVIRKACKLAKVGNLDEKQAIQDALVTSLGWCPEKAAKAVVRDCFGNYGFAAYQLTGNSAEVRRCKKRIAELESAETKLPAAPEVFGDVRIVEAENRVQMFFPGKPTEVLRDALKSAGFRWAPSVGAWQRMASPQAWACAREIANK